MVRFSGQTIGGAMCNYLFKPSLLHSSLDARIIGVNLLSCQNSFATISL